MTHLARYRMQQNAMDFRLVSCTNPPSRCQFLLDRMLCTLIALLRMLEHPHNKDLLQGFNTVAWSEIDVVAHIGA